MKKLARKKRIWVFLDGKPLCDAVQAALDNNIFVSELEKLLIKENPGHTIEIKVI